MSQPLIMSFRPDAAAMCLDGRKTMTRRLAVGRAFIPDDDGGAVYQNGCCLWRVGDTIAIKPGRTAKAVGRVLCTSLAIEHVQDITEEDAKREGCNSSTVTRHAGPPPLYEFGAGWFLDPRQGYADLWRRLNPSGPNSWDANPLVVVIGFEPIPIPEQPRKE